MQVLLLSLCIFFVALLTASAAGHTRWHQLKEKNYDFAQYVREFRKTYTGDEYATRRAIFEARLKAIHAHNSDPTKGWKEGVNHMTDYTPEEHKSMRGIHRGQLYASKPASPPFAYLQRVHADANVSGMPYPANLDWRETGAVTAVKNQGMCGSCWTFASAETVESHWFLQTGNLQALSEQQIASCTSNPKQCGGTGGCNGGTLEVAMASIIAVGGLSSEWTYPYSSFFGANSACAFNASTTVPAAKLSRYDTLPSNQYAPVMAALATRGPLAVNVDASLWSAYEGGIFDGCNQTNPVIDHGVQLVGYGTTRDGSDYWLVRNSWSPTFGESGYIRLARYSEQLRCGTDSQPLQGDGCIDGPPTVTVCGTCGILFDVVLPTVDAS